ncbi:MAG: RNA polymerase sigma factor [Cytophagaceae bacterium]
MGKALDKDIIQAIKSGDNQFVLSELYKNILPKIIGHIVKNNGNEDEAKDIFQDAVMSFYHQVKTGKFNEDYEINGFIFTVARNLWINRVKKMNRTIPMTAEEENMVNGLDLLENIITEERAYAIKNMLNQVGEECQKLLKYSTYDRLSMKEICVKMGFSSENVAKTYNYRCKQKLVQLIKGNQSVLKLFKV